MSDFLKVVYEMTPSEKRDLALYVNSRFVTEILARGWDIKTVEGKPLFTNPFIYFDDKYISSVLMDYVVGFKLKISSFVDFNVFNVEGVLDIFNDYFTGETYIIHDPFTSLCIKDVYIMPHQDSTGLHGVFILFHTCSDTEV